MMTMLTRVVGAAVATGSLALGFAAPALADDPPPPPNCTAADLAGVATGVSAAMSVYLFTHPDVNNFFTDLRGTSREELRGPVKDYMDANPQVYDELQGIRQPLRDFRERCGMGMPSEG